LAKFFDFESVVSARRGNLHCAPVENDARCCAAVPLDCNFTICMRTGTLKRDAIWSPMLRMSVGNYIAFTRSCAKSPTMPHQRQFCWGKEALARSSCSVLGGKTRQRPRPGGRRLGPLSNAVVTCAVDIDLLDAERIPPGRLECCRTCRAPNSERQVWLSQKPFFVQVTLSRLAA